MNLTPNQTIKGAVIEAPGLSGSMKDSRSINGTVAGAQSLIGAMKDIPTVDNTLSKEGYAADAKAVGEALKTKAPISHTEDKNNPHDVTAEQTGAAPLSEFLRLKEIVKNFFVVSDEEPTKTPALWFNTAGGWTSYAYILELQENENGYSVQAEIDGETYGVENATVNKTATHESFNFTVL